MVLRKLKEDVEKVRKTMYKQNGNSMEETDNLKRNQKEILEWRSTITEKKNSLEGFKDRFELEEERISELEGSTIEIIELEAQKEK